MRRLRYDDIDNLHLAALTEDEYESVMLFLNHGHASHSVARIPAERPLKDAPPVGWLSGFAARSGDGSTCWRVCSPAVVSPHRPERAALGDMLRLNAPNPVLAAENSSTEWIHARRLTRL